MIINEEELKELFALYYKRCYPLAPICDPVIHTLAGTAARSPFLLICSESILSGSCKAIFKSECA